MKHIICCNGYHHVGTATTDEEALRVARAHSCTTYDCIIQEDARIIGDKTGIDRMPTDRYTDAATQTGMYDR